MKKEYYYSDAEDGIPAWNNPNWLYRAFVQKHRPTSRYRFVLQHLIEGEKSWMNIKYGEWGDTVELAEQQAKDALRDIIHKDSNQYHLVGFVVPDVEPHEVTEASGQTLNPTQPKS